MVHNVNKLHLEAPVTTASFPRKFVRLTVYAIFFVLTPASPLGFYEGKKILVEPVFGNIGQAMRHSRVDFNTAALTNLQTATRRRRWERFETTGPEPQSL